MNLLIDHMDVHNAQGMSGMMVAGYPSPTAFYGFAMAVVRALFDRSEGFDFLIIHHACQERARFAKGERIPDAGLYFHQRAGTRTTTGEKYRIPLGVQAPLQPNVRVNLTFSLLIHFHDKSLNVGRTDLDQLLGLKCLGGHCAGIADVRWLSDGKAIEAIEAMDGYVLSQACDIDLSSLDFEDWLDLFQRDYTTSVVPHPDNPDEDFIESKMGGFKRPGGLGWINPCQLGYRALEAPQARSGVRQGARHCYAEPLFGVSRFTGIRRAFEHIQALSDLPFWRWCQPSKGVYLACDHRSATH